LALWTTALFVSLGLCALLVRILSHLRAPAVIFAWLLFGLPLAISALKAALNLARIVTANVVQAEIRVLDRTLYVRLPGLCRAVEYEWERGEVADLWMTWPKLTPRRWGVDLWVLSDDGHEVCLKLTSPGVQAAAEMEQSLRAALGLPGSAGIGAI
jgi:hypothetical protein